MKIDFTHIDEVVALDAVVENSLQQLAVSNATFEVFRTMLKSGQSIPLTEDELEVSSKDTNLLIGHLESVSTRLTHLLDKIDPDELPEIKPPKWK